MIGRRILPAMMSLATTLLGMPHAGALAPPTADPGWQADGRVQVIIRAGSTVYLGGRFTTMSDHAGHTVDRPHVAAIDAVTGDLLPWDPGPNKTVFAMAVSPDRSTLFIGGSFTRIAGEARARVAAFDTSTGALTPFSARVRGGGVRALAADDGSLFLGGAFSRVDGSDRGGLARLDATTGVLEDWDPGPAEGGKVRTLALLDSRLIVGGAFDVLGGHPALHLAAIDPASAAFLDWASHPNGAVITMAVGYGSVYLGTRNNLANRYEPTSGRLLFSKHGDGNVQALTTLDGVLYIGGHFTSFAGQAEPHVAAADALTGETIDWDARVNSSLGVFAFHGEGDLYMGGNFTRVSGEPQARFAILRTG
ncbi:MAG: hypothetical protein WBM72_02725 [Actinomycetota bacterium]